MLKVLSDSVLNGVDKSLGFAWALAKEILESFSTHKDVSLVFYLILVLLPTDQNSFFKKVAANKTRFEPVTLEVAK